MEFTNEAKSDCQLEAIFALDVLDSLHRLFVEKIPTKKNLAFCGFGTQKCSYLQKWINLKRIGTGKTQLKKGTIKPVTLISEVIEHVC